MKKKITRRLTAMVLSAALMLSPVGVFAEADAALPLAQVVITMEDGSEQLLPVQMMINSEGETVYWLDMTQLTPEQAMMLEMGMLTVTDPSGMVIEQYALSDSEDDKPLDGLVRIYDAANPSVSVPVMLAPMAMPEQPQDAEAVISGYLQQAEAERLAAEQAEAERLAAEQAEAERLAAEQAEAERLAAEQAEAERLAAEQAELERLAAEQAAAESEVMTDMDLDDEDEQEDEFPVPDYVTPMADNTNLRSETTTEYDNVLVQVGLGDVMAVFGYAQDTAGGLWWQVQDYRSNVTGYIMADVVMEVASQDVPAMIEIIEGEDTQQTEDGAMDEPLDDEIIDDEIVNDEIVGDEAYDEPAADEQEDELIVPAYVMPLQDATNLRAEPMIMDNNVIAQVGTGDLLAVYGYAKDAEGNLWWQVQDYRTGYMGCILASVVSELHPDYVMSIVSKIDMEKANAEQMAQQPEAPAEDVASPLDDEETDDVSDAADDVTDAEEWVDEETADTAPAVNYAVTNNRNSDINTLRDAPDGKKIGEYPNDVLVIFGEPEQDGKWYPVTIVEDNVQGYMRDYLLTQIAQSDAESRMAAILAEKANGGAADDDAADVPQETAPEAESDASETEDQETEDVPEVISPEDEQQEEEAEDEPEDSADDQPGESTQLPAGTISSFPAYGMTLEQANGAMIVLRKSAGGELPQDGAIPVIREPSPLEISGEEMDDSGSSWYLVRNMNNNETGYIEAFKVQQVTKETAEAAVKEIVSVIPTIPPQNVQPEDSQDDKDDQQPEQPKEDEKPEVTPEPEIPDVPQALEEGDVYHYGRNTGKQVALREKPNTNGKLICRMKATTVVWVMTMDGEWCHVRTDEGEGYMKAEFVELMDVREEQEYRDSLDDPEIVPEKTAPETGDDNEPEVIVPEVTPTPVPSEPVDTTPKEVGAYAYVNTDSTALRSNADDNAHMQAMLDADTVVYVVHKQANEDGTVWMLTQVEEMWGYVKEAQLTMMTEEQTAEYLAALEAAKATPTPTVEPTATPEPTSTPQPQRLELYARVINDGTPLRGNPDPNAYLQNILDKETVVFLFQSQIAADGMTWYLVQYSGQWGFVRADLVRVMGEQETADYLAQLEAQLATPTPMPQVTPEPIGPDSTSAYAKLIKDAVNLRRTPSQSGTSLGRIPMNTLLLVTGSEYDGTNSWLQVNYNGKDGYIRSDMAQMLTISELQDHLAQQLEQSQNASKPGASVTPNASNNTDIVINGSHLQDLIPVPDSWTNNVIAGMPGYATASPDPNATPTPVPVANPAALIRSVGDLSVHNIPALTREASFSVYGKAKPYTTVTATVEVEMEQPITFSRSFIATAIAENVQRIKRAIGQTVADVNGNFEMNVTLPKPGEYIVEFATADGAFAQYGVTYDTGATPMPTPQPLPTAMPVQEEDGGMNILPFIIGGVLILVAAGIYGVYVYRRKMEDEEEDEEDEDEEYEMRQEQLARQRQRSAQSARNAQQAAPRVARTTQVPSYMRQPSEEDAPRSPYARPQAPVAPKAPVMPQAPVAPKAPVMPQAPVAPKAPVMPQAPVAPKAPVMPQAPVAPQAPIEPQAPSAQQTTAEGAPRRRRRQQVDQD